MSDLKEKTLASTEILDGVLLKAFRDEVRLPDGDTSVREWIDHPGASAIVPLFENGDVLLVRQYRYAARRTFLEVPAGKLDVEGETAEDVARRELEEETGWQAGRFTKLASLYPCIGYSNEVIHFFLAEDLHEGTQELSDGEFVKVVRMPFEEAAERARKGEIRDIKSAMALSLADAALKERGEAW